MVNQGKHFLGGLPQVHQYFTVKCYLPTGGSDFFASITLLYKMYLTFISSFIALGRLIIVIFINIITALRKMLKACSVIKRVSKQDWGVQYVKRPKLFSKQVQQFWSHFTVFTSIDGSAIWLQCQNTQLHCTCIQYYTNECTCTL